MSTKPTGQGRFPMDNLTFDIVTVLYQKSKALEAYDKYIKDAQGNQQVLQVLEKIRKQDEDQIRELHQCLVQVIGKGTTAGATNP